MAAFSPDGQWLALSDRTLGSGISGGRHEIYRVGSSDRVAEVSMDHGPLAAHAFSPDGQLLAVHAVQTGRQPNQLATRAEPQDQIMKAKQTDDARES